MEHQAQPDHPPVKKPSFRWLFLRVVSIFAFLFGVQITITALQVSYIEPSPERILQLLIGVFVLAATSFFARWVCLRSSVPEEPESVSFGGKLTFVIIAGPATWLWFVDKSFYPIVPFVVLAVLFTGLWILGKSNRFVWQRFAIVGLGIGFALSSIQLPTLAYVMEKAKERQSEKNAISAATVNAPQKPNARQFGHSFNVILNVSQYGAYRTKGYTAYESSEHQMFSPGSVMVAGTEDGLTLGDTKFDYGAIIVVEGTKNQPSYRLATTSDKIILKSSVTVFGTEFPKGEFKVPKSGNFKQP